MKLFEKVSVTKYKPIPQAFKAWRKKNKISQGDAAKIVQIEFV